MSMTPDEMIAVIQAFKEGGEIQFRSKYTFDDVWKTTSSPVWNFESTAYRVKPKPE
jgi:hypothetical protein